MTDQQKTVVLHESQTSVEMTKGQRRRAVQAAYWATTSSHEHDWTIDEQLCMAQYVLWAHQRLCAIADCLEEKLERAEVNDGR